MKAQFQIDKPEDVDFTLKITMPLSHWMELRDQLQEKWPSSRLSSAITTMVANASKAHYPEQPA